MDGLAVWLRPDEQTVALAGEFRLIQRLKGHRYSSDDMLVGHRACEEGARAGDGRERAPLRVLDLGCGIGSVLLIVAWAEPSAQIVGVEVQPEHVALARRNVTLNGCEDRVTIVEGDLRDQAMLDTLGTFDLVTGTPPYYDPAATTICRDVQRAHAYWELRGGIEAYAHAAASRLAPRGRFVACAAASPPERATRALEDAGLHIISRQAILPRPDAPPFLVLVTAGRATDGEAPTRDESPLLMRNADGTRTRAHIDVREWCDIPRIPLIPRSPR